jgi:hypothetical protein
MYPKEVGSISHLREIIERKVSSDLQTRVERVALKFSCVHLFASMISLSVCPQFGFRILGEGHGLVYFFEVFGEWGCILACGGFFTAMTMGLTSLLFTPQEFWVLRSHSWLMVGSWILLSLGFFGCRPLLGFGRRPFCGC